MQFSDREVVAQIHGATIGTNHAFDCAVGSAMV